MANSKVKVVLNPGHGDNNGSGGYDPGAVNADGLQEHEWVTMLVNKIIQTNYHDDIELIKVNQTSYHKLPDQINEVHPDFAISFHLNAFTNEKATGTEMLYWHSSDKGRLLSSILYNRVQTLLDLDLRYEPIKPRSITDRGGGLLMGVACPIVISESFFITNPSDLKIASDCFDELACAYVEGIKEFASYKW